jgi:hypothetical protein
MMKRLEMDRPDQMDRPDLREILAQLQPSQAQLVPRAKQVSRVR